MSAFNTQANYALSNYVKTDLTALLFLRICWDVVFKAELPGFENFKQEVPFSNGGGSERRQYFSRELAGYI
jgi:hypothetical protein